MKKMLGIFGIRQNGSPVTFQGKYGDLIKLVLVVASVSYTLGGATIGLRTAPQRIEKLEREMISVTTVLASIDNRLARIETCLIKK